MTDLKIYRDQATPKNELVDEMLSLEKLGIIGGRQDEKPQAYTLYYDFKPIDHEDPLLLVTPRR